MDTGIIQISGLNVSCLIGTLAWEQQIPQKLIIDVSYQFNAKKIIESDHINDVVDYTHIIDTINTYAAQNNAQLLETFTAKLANHLQHTYSLAYVYLQVKKPGAVPNATYVSASIKLEQQ